MISNYRFPMIEVQKQKGISRIDSGSTHGWFVRGYRNGKTYSKLFSDRKCGGRDKALKLALEHRDELFKELDEIPAQRRNRRQVFRDARNTSGVIGVCRISKKGASGRINECYSVSWRPEPGVQKCTSFSIRKYGEEQAFRMAVEHRLKMMREIYGAAYVERLVQESGLPETAGIAV